MAVNSVDKAISYDDDDERVELRFGGGARRGRRGRGPQRGRRGKGIC